MIGVIKPLIKEFFQQHYHSQHVQQVYVIVNNFATWLSNTKQIIVHLEVPLIPGADISARQFITDTIVAEKKTPWFRKLVMAYRQEKKKNAMEERNQKIRKLNKIPSVEFFSDENILIHILQYLSLEFFIPLRASCSFLKDFLSKNFKMILVYQRAVLSFNVSHDLDIHHIGNRVHYKRLYLVSGIVSTIRKTTYRQGIKTKHQYRIQNKGVFSIVTNNESTTC